jgi:rhodanese-related sulfurtransferase
MNTTETVTLPFNRIKPLELKSKLRDNPALLLIDVRSTPEYQQGHIAEARLLPLDDCQPQEVRQHFGANQGSEIVLICQSGKRAEKVAQRLATAGFSNLEVLQGGTEGWIGAGLPVAHEKAQILPLMRQVQLTIGLLSFAGAVLAIAVSPFFALIPAFTGLGLTIAGATGWCGLALLLGKMPWNRVVE